MNWIIFWIVIYVAVILFFTIKHIKTNDADSYLINNRKTKTLPLVFTTMATFIGGGASMGLIAMGYQSGFTAVAIGVAYVIGFFICAKFAGRIREYGAKNSIYSFTEFLNRAYLKKNNLTLFPKLFSATVSVINIVMFFFLLSAQFVAMAKILEFTFEIGFLTAAIISCSIVIGYTAFAGLAGVIITDSIQFVIIVIMIIMIFVPGVLGDTGNFSRLSELPDEMLNGTGLGWVFLVAVLLILGPTVMVRLDIWQRLLAAESAKTARRVSIISGLGMLPFYTLFALVGMALKITYGDISDSDEATIWFIQKHTSDVLFGFAIIGLLSALMSSGDSYLNLIALTAAKGFKGWSNKVTSKEVLQKKVRLYVVIFGAVSMILALFLPALVDLLVIGLGAVVIFLPITIYALISKTITPYRLPALISVILGFITIIGFFIFGLVSDSFDVKSSFVPGFVVSLISFIVGVQVRKKMLKG